MSFTFTLSYFFWGTIFLLVSTLIFYIIFFCLIFYWRETRANYVVVPLLHTFEYFLTAFFIISFICVFLEYFPDMLLLIQ